MDFKFFRINSFKLIFFSFLIQFSFFFQLQAENTENFNNIIIISVDTLRADHLSCYGYPVNTSPSIDKLAEDSVLFERCFALTPLTAPSFSTMLTSLPSYKHGAKRNGLSIYNRIKTIPYYLKKAGFFSSSFISNWPLRKKLSRLHKYFDEYYEVFTKKRWLGIMQPEGKADDVTARSIKWIDKNRDKKFFLWVQYTEPHAPYIKHKKYDYSSHNVKRSVYPPGSNIKKIKKYDSEISYTDHFIGKLIEALKERKLYHNSLIIFVSDHGESFGEHNYYKHGRRLYNSTLNVPLIVKFPKNKNKKHRSSKIVTLLDIAPTILSVSRVNIPDTMEGKPLTSEDKSNSAGYIYFETYKGAVHIKKSEVGQIKVKPTYFSILEYPVKMIANVNFRNLKYKKIEVYNIENDFFETKNIWSPQNKKLQTLSKKLKKHIYNIKKYIKYSKKNYKQNSKLSKEDMEKLKSLGYI